MSARTAKVLVPTNIALDLAPIDGARFVGYDPALPVPGEHLDAEVLVTWSNPAGHLRDAAGRMPRLGLVQSLAAGTDAIEAAGFPHSVVVASGVGLHDRPVAEHTLALVLAAARRLHTSVRAQLEHRWAGEIGGVQPEPSPGVFSTLRGAKVVILGFGGIARTLAPHLVALGATVVGVARSARETDGIRVVTTHDLAAELGDTDVLIDILPATAETLHAVDAPVLAHLPAHAWFINVGRGATVDEAALLDALQAGRLGGAALDVFTEEPLPAGSPLWDAPNIIITPHAAGGRPLGAAALIAENVRAHLDGAAVRNRVAR